MNRRFSSFVKSKNEPEPSITAGDAFDDDESKITMTADVPLAPPSLKVKRLDYYYSKWSKTWKYRNMSSKITVEIRPVVKVGDNDTWKEFCFVVVRTVPRVEDNCHKPTFKVVIKSEYMLTACKDVFQMLPGISWTAEPLELDPELFVTFLPAFLTYRDELAAKKDKSEEEGYILASVDVLLDWLHTDYRSTISTIKNLLAHGEIKWELLHAILLPRSIFVAKCAVTGEPRAFKLVSVTRTALDGLPVYQLACESVDLVDRPMTNSVGIGMVQTIINLSYFKGTVKISSLDAFPIKYHPAAEELKKSLIKRGSKWLGLTDIHHKQYKGLAALQCGDKILKHNINSRIMIDRGSFKRRNANYPFPMQVATSSWPPAPPPPPPVPTYLPPAVDIYGNMIQQPPVGLAMAQSQAIKGTQPTLEKDLSDEQLLLAPSVVYGFSLSDKIWFEFDVDKVQDVDWNDDAFANLVIPSGRKALLQSLVEAHHKEIGFDDFIKGKGQGLVINLFGPPGVGKTFSAEATSEHVRRPLYVVGAGDLGTRAIDLDAALERVFDLATMWKAIVLIDEVRQPTKFPSGTYS